MLDKIYVWLFLSGMAVGSSLVAQQTDRQIELIPLRGSIYHVNNTVGGNIVVSIGDDGIFMIDAGSVPEHAKIMKSLFQTLSDKPVKYLFNTHWHSDHTAGNVPWGEDGVEIIAHENVLERLETPVFMKFFERESQVLAEAGRPRVLIQDFRTIQFNNEKIDMIHVGPGHTDGDGIVYFNQANIVHVGDLYFNGYYPYIGVSSGGSIEGMVKALRWVLKEMNDATLVVPGHGPISNKAELGDYVSMLADIHSQIQRLVEAGQSLEEIQKAKPTAAYDEQWGKLWMDGDEFVRLVVMDLSR